MSDNQSSDFTRFAGCGLAAAAIIAALALLIFALAYAGFIGSPNGGWGMMRGPGGMPMQNMPGNMPGAAMMTAQAQGSGATGTAYPGQAATPGTAEAAASGGAATAQAGTGGGSATARASAPAAGRPDRLVVEDWSGYADDDALAEAYSFNTAVPDNSLELRLEPSLIAGGPVGAVAAYSITVPAPNDYAGFDLGLAPVQDWSGYTHLSIVAEPSEKSARQLVLQWHETSGEVWRHRTQFEDIPTDGPLLIPLTADAWEWADWSARDNQKLDLGAVERYGLFIGHAGPGGGTVKLGPIEVVREP